MKFAESRNRLFALLRCESVDDIEQVQIVSAIAEQVEANRLAIEELRRDFMRHREIQLEFNNEVVKLVSEPASLPSLPEAKSSQSPGVES